MKRNRVFIYFTTIMLLMVLTGLQGCQGDIFEDENPYWDTDGDNISNCVENNNANYHHNFNPDSVDQNPSIAHGDPWDGSLEGGINLCDEEEGYKHFIGADSIDFDDWGTLALINMIEGGGRDWRRNCPPKMCILDMSKQEGGNWPPHSSHQNGLDVDIRYVRKDNQEIPLNIRSSPECYDTSTTINLMKSLFQTADTSFFDLIIVSDVSGIYISGIQTLYDTTGNHDTHFHLRIEDPDGIGN